MTPSVSYWRITAHKQRPASKDIFGSKTREEMVCIARDEIIMLRGEPHTADRAVGEADKQLKLSTPSDPAWGFYTATARRVYA